MCNAPKGTSGGAGGSFGAKGRMVRMLGPQVLVTINKLDKVGTHDVSVSFQRQVELLVEYDLLAKLVSKDII